MTKEAWVTVVTNDTYGLGALVLGCSLRRVGTTRDIVVMVTPGVSDRMREELARIYTSVIHVDVMDSGDSANLALMARPELGVTFTKLHAWTLVQYSKCVFLDADTLVIQNADELFGREELSAAPDPGWPDCFNSGVFVFVPSMTTYQALLDFAVAHGSFDGADQGLLNMFFKDWATQDIRKHLPFTYNLVASATYTYLPAFKHYGGQVKIVHFLGTQKPWTRQVEASSGPFQRAWWSIFREDVSSHLSQEMILCSPLTGRAREPSPTPRHRFRDPWLDYKPEPNQPETSHHSPQDPPPEPNLPPHASPPHALSCVYVTNNHTDTQQTGQFVENMTVFNEEYSGCNEQNKSLSTPYENNFNIFHSYINSSNFNDQENTSKNELAYNKVSQEYAEFSCEVNSNSDSVNAFDHQKENNCTHYENPKFNSDFNEKQNISINKIVFNHLNSNTSSNNPKTSTNAQPDRSRVIQQKKKDITTKNYINQRSEHRQTVLNKTEKDVTMREKDNTEMFLTPNKPNILQSESESNRGQFSLNGVAGALARGDNEGWRKEAWEAGDIDYLGHDSFDNIWRRICETVGIPQGSPQTAAPAGKEQQAETVVKASEQQITAQPREETKQPSAPISIPEPTGAAFQLPPPAIPQLPPPAEPTPLTLASTEPAPQPPTPVEPAPQPPASAEPAPQPPTPVEPAPQPPASAEPAPQPPTPVEPAPQPPTPFEPAPQLARPAEPAPQPAAPTPHLGAPSEAASQPAAAKVTTLPTVPTAVTPLPAASSEAVSQSAAPAEVVLQTIEPILAQPQVPSPPETTLQPAISAEPGPKSAASAELVPRPAEPTESVLKSATPTESVPQSAAPAESVPKSAALAESVTQSAAPAESVTQFAPLTEQALQPATPAPQLTTPALPGTPAEASPRTPVTAEPTSLPPATKPELLGETAPQVLDAKVDVTSQAVQEQLPVTAEATKEPAVCGMKPEECCGKPEECSITKTPADQGKLTKAEAVCQKPEKKPKEVPKPISVSSEPKAPSQEEQILSTGSTEQPAEAPKKPETPTITPPSAPITPLVADDTEVCKLQATQSQPPTPPAGGSEQSEPPVPPKRKQGKNGKPAPKGGKK